jgi:hypothetical protein
MKPDRMGHSLLPFTHAAASHTRWGIDSWDEFEARNVLTPFDRTGWNSGAFAPVTLTVGWGVPQHCIAGLWLSPDMVPGTGEVEVEVRANGHELLCTHKAEWRNGQILSILFPRLVHTETVRLTFTKSPSWVALLWAQAWQFRGGPTVVKSPIAPVTTLLRRRRGRLASASSGWRPPPPPPQSEPSFVWSAAHSSFLTGSQT